MSATHEGRAAFKEWSKSLGDPGGNALAGGPPVTREALAQVRGLGITSLSEKDEFRLAALLDTVRADMDRSVRSQIKERLITAFQTWAKEWHYFQGGNVLAWMQVQPVLTQKAVNAVRDLGMPSFSVKEALLVDMLTDAVEGA